MQRLDGLVSVIIPAYNAATLIAETIDSILEQRYAQVEIIVVDDGSTDDTDGVVARYGASVRFATQANSGSCSSPRNHGLRLARGEYITFFDADDIMCPDKLAHQIRFLQAHPAVSMVLMDYRNFDESGAAAQSHFDTCRQLRAALSAAPQNGVLESSVATTILITENYGIAGSPVFRASLLDVCGAFDEALKASEDFDLIYRAARAGDIGVLDEVGFMRRIHSANMSNRTAHILEYKIASRTKLMHTEEDPKNRRRLREAVANFHMSLAEHLGRLAPGRALYHTWEAAKLGCNAPMRMLKSVARSLLGVFGQVGRDNSSSGSRPFDAH